jgi:alcohol dehydrogenase
VSDLYALKSIELIANYLPAAVKDGTNLEARSQVALANTLSGFVESTSTCTSEHSLEHAMSAFHPELQHGAGLIIVSVAYFSFFVEHAPDRFILMANAMGKDVNRVPEKDQPYLFIEALKEMQKKCGVDNLKMSDYGIKKTEFDTLADNAVKTMGGLFNFDRYKLTHNDVVKIYKDSYK